jgi:hypothetical protein
MNNHTALTMETSSRRRPLLLASVVCFAIVYTVRNLCTAAPSEIYCTNTTGARPAAASVGSAQKEDAEIVGGDRTTIRVSNTAGVDARAIATTARSSIVNFRLHRDRYVDEFSSCFNDEKCHLMYFHFGKTGGTGILQHLFKAHPPFQDDCCNNAMVARFEEDPGTYCSAKVSSYDVRAAVFLTKILPFCRDLRKDERYVVFITFREPIQRALSSIHQMCNKNSEKRGDDALLACSHCSYDRDQAYWDEFIQIENAGHMGMLEVVTKSSPSIVLTMDSPDISAFYKVVHDIFPNWGFNISQPSNPEKTATCNFGFNSDMMRGLQPSQEVYRTMTISNFD